MSAGVALAQPTPSEGASRATIEDKGEKLYYLQDANKEYRFIGESSYEEYQKWYDEFRNNDGSAVAPNYALNKVAVVGKAEEGYVDLELTYSFEIREKGWVKASLGLAGASLRETPVVSGDTSWWIKPDSSTGKYLLWLKSDQAESPQKVDVRLKVAVRTESNGDEVRFNLNVSSPAQFSMQLSLPPHVTPTAAGSGIVTDVEQIGGATLVSVETGSGSTLQLSWGPSRRVMQDDVPILRATGDIEVTIEDDLQLKSTATLQVTSLNGVPIESFDVRIADDAEWLPPSQAVDYEMREVFLTQEDGEEQRFVRIEFSNKLPSREVELKTRQGGGDAAQETRATAGIFDVWQAKEQEGKLRLKYSENVIASWSMRNYRREKVGEAMDERAAFSYSTQPAELDMKAIMNQPTLQATSSAYQFVLTDSEAKVDVDFVFSVPKSFTESIVFDLNGWQEVVKFKESDVDWAQAETVDGQWFAPLLAPEMDRTTTTARVARISFTASLPLAGKAIESVSLPLIRPQVAKPTSAAITVRTAKNLKASPRFAPDSPFQIDMLAAQDGAGRQPLHLRMMPTEETPTLELSLEKVQRQIFVTPRAAIDIEPPPQRVDLAPPDSRCQVVQTFQIRAFYGEIGNLLLYGAPRSTLSDLVIRLDGEEVGYAQRKSSDETEPALRIDVVGRPEKAELTLEYKISSPGAALASSGGDAPLITTIPLVSLAVEETSADPVQLVTRPTQLSISSHTGIRVAAPDPAWIQVRRPDPSVLLQLESVADGEAAAPSAVTLELLKRTGDASDLRTRVKRCWIQEALTSDSRRTRASFLLQTHQPSLTLRLPAGAQTIESNWKWQPIPGDDKQGVTLRIEPTQRSQSSSLDTLEVVYKVEGSGLESGARLEAPALEDAVYLEPVYYQLACPSDWLCLWAPGLTEEMHWQWQGLSFLPVERIHQDRLENWAEASTQSSFPPGMSQYLYSSVGAPKVIEPWFVRRRTLMLTFGGLSLAVGLGLFYLPQVRRASVIGVLIAAAAGMSIFYPHHAVLFGGMASIGLVCTLFSIVLYFALGTRRGSRTVVRRTSSESQLRAPSSEANEPVSTTAGSGLLKSSSAEA
ncbi:MAG: hypothetical protein ACIALR_13345 [Blastopirellula sp. JB062]